MLAEHADKLLINNLGKKIKRLQTQLAETQTDKQIINTLKEENRVLREDLAKHKSKVGQIAQTISTAFEEYQCLSYNREQSGYTSASPYSSLTSEICIYTNQDVEPSSPYKETREKNAESNSEYSVDFI